MTNTTAISFADKLYSFLLFLYPAEFRLEYGSEMQHIFREGYRENSGAPIFLAGALGDLLVTALRQHLEILVQDVDYALRMLWKQAGFTTIVVLTLALGIGANTAIFSVVNTVLLRPLPYPNSEQLVAISSYNQQKAEEQRGVSPADLLDWRAQSSAFESLSLYRGEPVNLTGTSQPQRFSGIVTSTNFFETLGVKPLLGRTFSPDEDIAGKRQVVVLSYALWQQNFGGDPLIISKTFTLNDQPYTVIGVMPPGFAEPSWTQLWLPLANNSSELQSRQNRYFTAIGRLKPAVSLEQAQVQLDTITIRLDRAHPDTNHGWRVRILSLQDQLVGNIRPVLLILLGAVGCVLLIASTNVANLLLARTATRQYEFAIRSALGASQTRMIRQLLTESVLLALLGGSIGVLFALGGLQLLIAFGPADIPRIKEVSLDGWVLSFTLGISLLTGLVFGLFPALPLARGTVNQTLKGKKVGSGQQRTRDVLVIGETAMALTLLAGSGLLITSFLRLQEVQPGFDTHNLLTMVLSPADFKYPSNGAKARFYQQVLDNIEALPGVTSVAAISDTPLSGSNLIFPFRIREKANTNTGDFDALYHAISPNYFQTMAIPLLMGRTFNIHDDEQAPSVVIINETMAHRFFANENPIGKHLVLDYLGKPFAPEIVGVVGNVKHNGLAANLSPEMYVSGLQLPWFSMTLVLRTAMEPLSLSTSAQRAVWQVDKDLPISYIQTMEKIISDSVAPRLFQTLLLGLFAGVALLLAAVGVSGVLFYSVTKRTPEIGIRLALGARPQDIFKLIIAQGMSLVAIGLGLGLIAALALTRFLNSLLFEVNPSDPFTFVFVSGLLLAAALMACYLPARRAMGVNPIEAIRYE
ncbi:MAG: ABC transporter permease [Anaerolineae bacterium]|nr:ABC transporter permease [Gloeobacterales cyanobacterium ES-bin-313]